MSPSDSRPSESKTAPLFKLHDSRREEIQRDFFRFLSFASISTEPEFKGQILECVNWLRSYLTTSGFDVQVWETALHPVVYASWLKAGPEKPTVLIYNHYDVQPVDPLELWQSPPFEPTVRNGQVYARGAVDDKGQCFYVLSALRALLERDGTLPVNIKLCIEGEEEAGSMGLAGILASKAKELAADHLLVVDLGFHKPNEPQVCLGLRGIASLTVEAVGSTSDLHSGGHGGLVYNPNHAVVELLAKLRDANGRIAVPGFYDEVVELTAEERKSASFDVDLDEYRKNFSAEPTGGEKNIPPGERISIRPTIEVNGIGGGYTGPGFKTVIPAKTLAKVSARLVPNQDPNKTTELIAQFLERNAPPGIKLTVTPHHGGPAIRTSVNAKCVRATAQAYTEVLGKQCRFYFEGGSIPIIPSLAEVSGAEVALFGYGLPTDALHAPNEHFGLDRFRQGFVTIIRILEILGAK